MFDDFVLERIDLGEVVPSAGADAGWQVDVSGQTSGTPFHAKWFSLRVYDGVYSIEPDRPPVVAIEKSYGERVGQGVAERCSGGGTEIGPFGTPISVFLDIDIVRL